MEHLWVKLTGPQGVQIFWSNIILSVPVRVFWGDKSVVWLPSLVWVGRAHPIHWRPKNKTDDPPQEERIPPAPLEEFSLENIWLPRQTVPGWIHNSTGAQNKGCWANPRFLVGSPAVCAPYDLSETQLQSSPLSLPPNFHLSTPPHQRQHHQSSELSFHSVQSLG